MYLYVRVYIRMYVLGYVARSQIGIFVSGSMVLYEDIKNIMRNVIKTAFFGRTFIVVLSVLLSRTII